MGLLGELLEAAVKTTIEKTGEAYRTQQNAQNLSNSELLDRYNNSTGSEKVGYAAEIKNRTGR